MYCQNCGKEIENKSKFCQYCGTRVPEDYRVEETVDSNNNSECEKQETKVPSKKSNWIGNLIAVVFWISVCCLLYYGIYSRGDLQHHTDPISSLMAKKCGLNQDMDFGDFSMYFDEEIAGVREYSIGTGGYYIKTTDADEQLCGLAGIISVTNGDYVYLGNIDVTMHYTGSSQTYVPDYRAIKTDAGLFNTEDISSLTRHESAYIAYAGTHSPDEHVERAVLYYKDSKGKRHLYYVEP